MNVQKKDTTGHPLRSLLGAAVFLLLALLLTAGLKSYSDLAAARAHESSLERQISETRHSIDVLQDRIERIKNDPVTLERLAREDLGLVKPGDVVIVLPEDDTAEAEPF